MTDISCHLNSIVLFPSISKFRRTAKTFLKKKLDLDYVKYELTIITNAAFTIKFSLSLLLLLQVKRSLRIILWKKNLCSDRHTDYDGFFSANATILRSGLTHSSQSVPIFRASRFGVLAFSLSLFFHLYSTQNYISSFWCKAAVIKSATQCGRIT